MTIVRVRDGASRGRKASIRRRICRSRLARRGRASTLPVRLGPSGAVRRRESMYQRIILAVDLADPAGRRPKASPRRSNSRRPAAANCGWSTCSRCCRRLSWNTCRPTSTRSRESAPRGARRRSRQDRPAERPDDAAARQRRRLPRAAARGDGVGRRPHRGRLPPAGDVATICSARTPRRSCATRNARCWWCGNDLSLLPLFAGEGTKGRMRVCPHPDPLPRERERGPPANAPAPASPPRRRRASARTCAR